jgi:hypothetical protein
LAVVMALWNLALLVVARGEVLLLRLSTLLLLLLLDELDWKKFEFIFLVFFVC